ncbi:uncharacterized protein LOC100832600 isoform X2 [Brachypodium distachyon]|uniref:uncharacterized protein LOC100832600 isoform X2 n=1 Tax=Brachypodium distachyon TaxID=15368 RepID=UPI00071DF722|nr:uncharacterized protein LOC100832600 isoform X2 [Brachypodium distachyon]|eukprot:XP_014758190.1 uncharacterized protein LOC100832600 isoform X2 [Brachypodium distachyon]
MAGGGGHVDQTARLSGDEFAEILRRVPPRWLAASRCVSKSWRAAIDGHGLLRADLLPLSVAGLFFHLNQHIYPEFLSCPSSSVSGRLDFLRHANPKFRGGRRIPDYRVLDQCNGLLLLPQWVVNPATGRWITLPPSPAKEEDPRNRVWCYQRFLDYDPTVSPHLEVLMVPSLVNNDYYEEEEEENPLVAMGMAGLEWPPSPCKMHVFSSRSGRWTLGELRLGLSCCAAAHLRGTLYIHCLADSIMRISLADNTYRMIKTPVYAAGLKPYRLRIDMGRSENGVYFASLHNGCLRVWILKELCGGEVEWILKHENDLKPMLVVHPSVFDRPVHGQGPWILEDINYNLFWSPRLPEDDREITVQENSEWYYNNGNPLDNGHEARKYSYWDTDILGFHPYKEIYLL